jgi:quinoprotein glucose dehydrogenase
MTQLVRPVCYGFLIVSLFVVSTTPAQQGARNGEWRTYGGDEGSTRYSPLDQINRDNIKNMRVAWVWKSDSLLPSAQPTSETTPIMVNGVLYFTMDQRRIVIAARAGTGETLWIYRPDEGERFDQAPRKIHRGVSYWTDGRGDERIFFVTPGFQLIALNAKNGAVVSNFGRQGIVDLFKELDLDYKGDPTGKIGNSSPVVISHDTIVVGPALTPGSRSNKANVKGDVMAFDVRTGKKKWVFHTIPRKGEPGYESWLNGSAGYTGNAGVWGPFSVDSQLGYVYLNVESATNDPYGGSRHGNNLYSGSLVCLDIRTGKMIWYFQLVHHDIWDFDMPPHPILVDINVDGKPVKAVVQLSKQAFAYVFDRVTGKPVWPIDERPVPQTDVEGEWTSPTQPIPSKPPAFDVQGVTPDNIINFTPALKQTALQLLQGYKTGPIFTPPTSSTGPSAPKGLIQVPGYGGGANWESGAADAETGFVYVGSITDPRIVLLTPNSTPTPTPGVNNACCDSDYTMGGTAPQLPNGLRLMQPPYGRITAYDMNKGVIAWQIPNGDTPPNIKDSFTAAGLTNIPPTGSPSRAGLLVTKSFLFAGEGVAGQAIFHAYDKKTGESVWQAPLPAGPQTALPMTYMYQGNQYIVLATRGPQGSGAQLVAWTVAPPTAVPGGGQPGAGAQ